MYRLLIALAALLFYENVWAIDVHISTSIEKNGKPIVVGQTNLPDNTTLLMTISAAQDSYRAQSKITVSRGQFRAGPFTQKGAPLSSGDYILDISTPLTSLQPPDVQAVIGKNGNNLSGVLIETLPFGDNVVRYQTKFRIEENPDSSKKSHIETQRKFQLIEMVKNSPCKQGGTIQDCLKKKSDIPAVRDIGWSVKIISDRYIVEKQLQIGGLRSPTIYRWSVTSDGFVSPENGHALSLSEH